MSCRKKPALCRLCLKKTDIYLSLFESNFINIIQDLTSIEISSSDPFAKTSCLSCIEDLKNANDTRQRILESDRILRENEDTTQSNSSSNKSFTSAKNEIYDDASDGEYEEKIVIKTEGSLKNDVTELLNNVESSSNMIEILSEDSLIDEDDETYDLSERSIEEETEDDDEESKVNKNKDIENLGFELDPNLDKSVVDAIKEVFKSKGKKRPRTKRDSGPTKNYKCPVCDIEFEGNRYAYNLHMCKHKKSECKLCGIWIRSDNMAKHLECHTSGPRICDLCGTTCKNVESLRGHIFYMHRKSADEYKCDQCEKSFRMKYKLDLHKKKEHIGLRNIVCPTCNKGFFTTRDMNHHVNMTHLKLRPHICPHCQRGFSSKYALKTHVRQHTNETPYKCYICAEGFRQNVSLRTHLKSKHNVEESKDFVCEFCEKGFSTDHALKVHLRLHPNNNYTCELCGKMFAQRIFLDNHIKWVHGLDGTENLIKEEQLEQSKSHIERDDS